MSRPKINICNVTCLNCGDVFRIPPSRLKLGLVKFCSNACRYPYMKAHGMFQPDGRSTAECIYCGKTYEDNTFAITTRRKYCSKGCSEKSFKTRDTALDSRLILKCLWCKKDYRKCPSQYADGRSKFCSRNCSGAWVVRHRQNRVSVAEAQFFDLVEAEGLALTRQMKVSKFIVDAVARTTNLAIEFDGEYWHSLPRAIERDARKEFAIAFAGLKLIRIAERLFIDDPDAAVQSVLRAAREI